MTSTLKFCPLQSCVDVSFWSELGSRKLDEFKLSEKPIDISGFLTASRYEEVGSLFQVSTASFNSTAGSGSQQGPSSSAACPGQLLLTNTLESFKQLDKSAALQSAGAAVWQAITSGAAEQQPSLLSRFLLLAFGDLKRFVFHYWFAFPALKPPSPFQQLSATPLSAAYPELQQQICNAADTWRCSSSSSSSSLHPDLFFLMQVDHQQQQVATSPISNWQQLQTTTTAAAAAAAAAAQSDESQRSKGQQELLLVMLDPCHLPLTPGWPLRNMLLLAAVRWGVRRLKVVAVRDSSSGRASADRSYVLEVELPDIPVSWPSASSAGTAAAAAAAAAVPQALGWEADAKGKLLPRHVDLSPLLSPVQLAEQAVDLNLKLMRWRAAPDLDVPALAHTKCLLLGAGTLGCAVARTLQAYGIRHITFVDSSTVSYSNPVRQSLFTFDDCLEGGTPKAAAAAEALRGIFPSVVAAGVQLSIPMPGHPPANAPQEQLQQQACQQLADLVSCHDVIFLLTDTRESRWLPTLLAAAAGKVAVTAALGFDNFVVMRHGMSASPTAASEVGGKQLGCYFCNDVVAPLNSTIDRTLDQQCTVARPGLAPIAGAIAVELMAALLQHPLKGRAPAPLAAAAAAADSSSTTGGAAAATVGALGPVPHMIRGQLLGFSQVCMVGQAFSQCTACSPIVVQRYNSEGWGFVREVLVEPSLLEELTGLAELHRQAAAVLLSDDDQDDGDGNEEGCVGKGDEVEGVEEDWTEL